MAVTADLLLSRGFMYGSMASKGSRTSVSSGSTLAVFSLYD